MATAATLENPILNSPYDPPGQHFVLGSHGPTGEIKVGRRPSESFIPIPTGRRPKALPGQVGEQEALNLDTTGERREANSLINELRFRVDRWRALGYPRVTPVSRKLLQHWADPAREDRVLFCQREAAETAIYLAEVAGRQGEVDFRRGLDEENRVHNDGLPRVALKMATGTGKTIVMAMLIAWQTANKAFSRRDAHRVTTTPYIPHREDRGPRRPSPIGSRPTRSRTAKTWRSPRAQRRLCAFCVRSRPEAGRG